MLTKNTSQFACEGNLGFYLKSLQCCMQYDVIFDFCFNITWQYLDCDRWPFSERFHYILRK